MKRRPLKKFSEDREMSRPLLTQKEVVVPSESKKPKKLKSNITKKHYKGKKRIFFTFTVTVQISATETEYKPKTGKRFEGTSDELNAYIEKLVNDYWSPVGEHHEVQWDTLELSIEEVAETTEKIGKVRMRDEAPFNLTRNIFTNIEEIPTTDGNCVKDTMKALYPRLDTKNRMDKLTNANTEELMEFCREYGIRAIAYNIKNQVIAENIPAKDNKNHRTLVYLCYMNHLYLLKPKHKFLIDKPVKDLKHERLSSEELNAKFRSIVITDKINVKDIHLRQKEITSFIHDNTLFFANDDYDICKEVISRFMFSDKVDPTHNFSNLLQTLEQVYTAKFPDSFFPIEHTKPPFLYNITRDETRAITSIDKNKAYSSILSKLPYLLSTDIRTYESKATNEFTTEYALYICKPKQPTILMPRQDIYAGSHVKFCLNKFEFEIQEILICTHQDNYYEQLISDLYDAVEDNIAKIIVNRAVGCFQKTPKVQDKLQNTIIPKDEINPDFYSFKFDKDIYIQTEAITPIVTNLYNRKPIAIQIKDGMNRMLYEKMEELSLTDEDIVQINTDSITFYTKPKQTIKLGNTLNDWKSSTYIPKTCCIYDLEYEPVSFLQKLPNDNTIITGFAGNGKSYHIQNMDLTDSIILSCKHSAIRQHREKNLNAHVIQKFCMFRTTIPKESHIIVEECGILTKQHWDFLFKCFLLNKKLTILGDFDQLLPVDQHAPMNQPAFLNMVFNNQYRKDENWRNNFTPEYYQSLINSTDKKYLKQEVLKYSTKTPEEADIIIAYRGSDDAKLNVVKKYNNYMLEHLNKSEDDPDVPMMCKTNDLSEKDIYNNFILLRKDITDEDMKKGKFIPAYARTLYNMQGDETKSYYLAPEDIEWFANPRMAYTLISRLKTK